MTSEYLPSEVLRGMCSIPDRDYTAEYLAEVSDIMGEQHRFTLAQNTTVRIAGTRLFVPGSMSESYYHGCSDCASFSLSFVGAPYTVTKEDTENSDWDENQLLILDTEEDYEKLKTLFVTHFNKHHREIIKNREKDTRKYNIVSKKEQSINIVTTVNGGNSGEIFGGSMFHEIALVQPPNNTGTIDNVIGAEIPEYETTGEESTRRFRD